MEKLKRSEMQNEYFEKLDDNLEFSIMVNDKPLREYQSPCGDGKTYVEADLFSPVSYFIEEEIAESLQKYPVTPFIVKGKFYNAFSTPAYLKLTVDSRQIWMKPFAPHRKEGFCVRGYKCDNQVRELLFTLPSFEKDEEASITDDAKADLGTIKIECIEAVDMGFFYTWGRKFQAFDKPGHIPMYSALNRLHKTQAAGATTRDGRVLSKFEHTGTQRRMVKYNVGNLHYGEKVLHYRTRHMLQDLGITDVAWKKKDEAQKKKEEAQKKKEEAQLEKQKSDKLKAKKKSEDKDEENTENSNPNIQKEGMQKRDGLSEKMSLYSPSVRGVSKMSVFSPSLKDGKLSIPPCNMEELKTEIMEMETGMKSNKLFCFSPSPKAMKKDAVEKEGRKGVKRLQDEMNDGKEYRVIEIDDDLCVLEEMDDDVIWMGDESCCFMDVTPPEIPMVDLCQDGNMSISVDN
ncbi:hypothetical protein FSP39_015553 [Pinctada imbricata]|uniref:Uncharacterized protein n=1 Tax=Pinctada imbricata TaxID=66713 RepID=A0AA88XWP4_PINIB|nr:hypothetical protein FSP39_015553 [Pinctada imbricata]